MLRTDLFDGSIPKMLTIIIGRTKGNYQSLSKIPLSEGFNNLIEVGKAGA